MSFSTEISNYALSHIGVSKPIADVETEISQEAKACRRFYEDTLKMVFREHNWGFATKTQSLSLVASNPTTEWNYSYAYPSNCMRINKILSGTSFDTRESRIDYRKVNNGSQVLLYCNLASAVAEFVEYTEDTTLYPVDFKMGFSFLLAYFICPSLSKGDPFKIKNEMYNQYLNIISRAKANELNEEQWPKVPEAEMIRGRET